MKPISRRRTWSQQAEQASLGMRAALLDDAVAKFQGLNDLPLQMRLAREVALARGAELTLAYKNVVMVNAGFRRRVARTKEKLVREPCVVFVVRRKWKKGAAAADRHQILPAHLLSYVTLGTQRLMVAVPTDVQTESRYAAAHQHSARAIFVDMPASPRDAYGTLTALLRIDEDGSPSIRGLSAMHVLTPSFSAAQTGPLADAAILQANGLPQLPGAAQVGTSSAAGGRLVPGPALSFDAQLIELQDAAGVDHMLDDVALSVEMPFVESMDHYDYLALRDPDVRIEVLLPANHPQAPGRARLFLVPHSTSGPAQPVPYSDTAGALMMVHHSELIHLQVASGPNPIAGDSGSPVVLWLDDGTCTFVGMFIAGDADLIYVLPAWILMAAPSYLGTLDAGSTLSLMT